MITQQGQRRTVDTFRSDGSGQAGNDGRVRVEQGRWWVVVIALLLIGSAASIAQPVVTVPRILQAAFGRQIVFYPFDSLQYPARFAHTASDVIVPNPAEVDPGWHLPLSEAIYQHSQTAGLIASGITINPTSTVFTPKQMVLNNQSLLGQQRIDMDSSRCGYFVLTGHLFDSFSAPNTAPIFCVAVYHQLAPGQNYLENNLTVATAGATGLELLVDSFTVTKGELLGRWPYQTIREHREISHRTDLYWRAHDGGPGPLHPNQPNGREQALDIRVYWTGAEKAALRSVAFRDSLGELVLGTSQNSIDFRDSIIREARMILQGLPAAAPTDSIHSAIFGSITKAGAVLDFGYDRCRMLMGRLLEEVIEESQSRKKEFIQSKRMKE